MKILIKSRPQLEKKSLLPFAPNTAVISICDYGDEFPKLLFTPEWLLQISFNDIDNDVFIDEIGKVPTGKVRKQIEQKYHMVNEQIAMQIATFYVTHKEHIECLICQCEHGQSRSAAIAAAILEHRGERGIRIFANDKYYPNKLVFREVYSALQKIIEG